MVEILTPGRPRGGAALVPRSTTVAPAPEDPDLAAQIRAGHRRAIQTVVETYLAQILRAARGAGLDPQLAEDVTQATFTTFIEAVPRPDVALRYPLQEDRRSTPRAPARLSDG